MSMGQSKVAGVVAVILATALAGCGGAEEIASPGSGGNVTINNPPPTIPNDPDPTPDTGLAVAADECPAIANPVALNDEGIIEGPTGAYRVCSLPAQFTVSTTPLGGFPARCMRCTGESTWGPDRGAAPTGGDPAVVLDDSSGRRGVCADEASSVASPVNRGNRLEAAGTAAAPDRLPEPRERAGPHQR